MNKKLTKVTSLKLGGIQSEEKRKETCFVSSKDYFSSCYFFIIPFPLHFKNDFYSLKSCSHNILNHSKWNTYDEDIINVQSKASKWCWVDLS
jgi:hypothetical protein